MWVVMGGSEMRVEFETRVRNFFVFLNITAISKFWVPEW
jgi:hypothetical protein